MSRMAAVLKVDGFPVDPAAIGAYLRRHFERLA